MLAITALKRRASLSLSHTIASAILFVMSDKLATSFDTVSRLQDDGQVVGLWADVGGLAVLAKLLIFLSNLLQNEFGLFLLFQGHGGHHKSVG